MNGKLSGIGAVAAAVLIQRFCFASVARVGAEMLAVVANAIVWDGVDKVDDVPTREGSGVVVEVFPPPIISWVSGCWFPTRRID